MVIRAIVSAIVMVIAAISGIWGALALWYQCPGGVTARWGGQHRLGCHCAGIAGVGLGAS